MSALADIPIAGLVAEAFAEGLETVSRMGVVAWAEQNFRIKKGPEPGRLRINRAPYMREILECFASRVVRQLTLKTSAQVGKTTMILVGYAWIVRFDNADTLWVMAGQDTAEELMRDKVQPAIQDIADLAAKFTGVDDDVTQKSLRFIDGTLFMGWAKSAASLASRSCKRVFFDETGKYPTFASKEASPVRLGMQRAKNFWDRLVVLASTPTTKHGIISEQFELSDQRYYHVPCPHCGVKQKLIWDQLKFGEDHDPDRIEREGDAWYECIACAGKIKEQHRYKMLMGGEWIPDRPEVTTHRGYHLSVLYSPWVPWATTAATFLKVKDRTHLLMDFWNSDLGLDWVEKDIQVTEDAIEALKLDYGMGIVPTGGLFLTLGADTQDDGVYYVVRAWGYHDESWMIDCGKLMRTPNTDDDFAQLLEILNTQYEHRDGSRMRIRVGCVDSGGHRTSTVYKFAYKSRRQVYATKGASHTQARPWMDSVIERAGNLVIGILDTDYFKTTIHDMRTKLPAVWHIPVGIEKEYVRQISAEEKVHQMSGSGQRRAVWVLRDGYVANHYWDCEVGALAAAERVGLRRLMPPEQQAKAPVRRGGLRRPDGQSFIARR